MEMSTFFYLKGEFYKSLGRVRLGLIVVSYPLRVVPQEAV